MRFGRSGSRSRSTRRCPARGNRHTPGSTLRGDSCAGRHRSLCPSRANSSRSSKSPYSPSVIRTPPLPEPGGSCSPVRPPAPPASSPAPVHNLLGWYASPQVLPLNRGTKPFSPGGARLSQTALWEGRPDPFPTSSQELPAVCRFRTHVSPRSTDAYISLPTRLNQANH